MPVYKWEGKDRQGQVLKGELEATSTLSTATRARSHEATTRLCPATARGLCPNCHTNIPAAAALLRR